MRRSEIVLLVWTNKRSWRRRFWFISDSYYLAKRCVSTVQYGTGYPSQPGGLIIAISMDSVKCFCEINLLEMISISKVKGK